MADRLPNAAAVSGAPASLAGLNSPGDWQQRMETILAMMREMSVQTDPQQMVRAYARRMQELYPADARISLSRRGLQYPFVRVTRYSGWSEEINPWKQQDQLPVIQGGLLAELIYNDAAKVIDELRLDEDDPGREFFAGMRSLRALPLFDGGEARNMVIVTSGQPAAFRREDLPELVWMANLFGRATHNLVMAEELEAAYRLVDRELKTVGDIQRSLLPKTLPEIPTLRMAAYYQTSQRAGGDYYDFFPLPDGHWGILMADVSGHGTPAAVLMAVTHSIAHTYPGPTCPPGMMLDYLNHHLVTRYTASNSTFVTAFYGIYNPDTRKLVYANAGHNPPRLRPAGQEAAVPLDGDSGLPLGITETEAYRQNERVLQPGDRLLLYTDGITEAQNPAGELFGLRRLDEVIRCCQAQPQITLQRLLDQVQQHTAGEPATDDRTLLVIDVE